MDPSVTLLEIHKLMYFMQEAGEPLRLQWARGPYGPYAENLRHVLTVIDGHFISGYGDGADEPDKAIELKAEAARAAEGFLDGHPEVRACFDRVASLIEGFETPFGMELLATVHWVATREGADSADAALARTHEWNPRKLMFTDRHVRLAYDVLGKHGWLAAS